MLDQKRQRYCLYPLPPLIPIAIKAAVAIYERLLEADTVERTQ